MKKKTPKKQPEKFTKKAISYNDGQDVKAYVTVKERLRFLKFHKIRYDFLTENSEYISYIQSWRVKCVLVIHPPANLLEESRLIEADIRPGVYHGESAVRASAGKKALELAHTGAMGRAMGTAGILIDDELSSYDEVIEAKQYIPDKEPTIAQKIKEEGKKYLNKHDKKSPKPEGPAGIPAKGN